MSVTAAKRYIHIYTEANPNPNSMKFVLNFMLAPDGQDFDFPDISTTQGSPLAAELFKFPFIERVFIMNNFVTITKAASVDWNDVVLELKGFLKQYFEDEGEIFTQTFKKQFEANASHAQPATDIEKKIVEVLEEYVKPAVESDGGAITFKSFQNGVVAVELRGSCSGCPSSTLTLKAGIENLLKQMVPGVEEVVAVGM